MGENRRTHGNPAGRAGKGERRGERDASREPIVTLNSRIERLALQERDAVRRRDWPTARSAAEERAVLQEARQRTLARRLA